MSLKVGQPFRIFNDGADTTGQPRMITSGEMIGHVLCLSGDAAGRTWDGVNWTPGNAVVSVPWDSTAGAFMRSCSPGTAGVYEWWTEAGTTGAATAGQLWGPVQIVIETTNAADVLAQGTGGGYVASNAGGIAAAVKGTLGDTLGALQTNLNSIGAAIGDLATPTGDYTGTFTLARTDGTRIVGARIELQGTAGNLVAFNNSDANGLASLPYDAGTYVLILSDAGAHTFGSSGQTISLTGNTTATFYGAPFDPGANAPENCCNVYIYATTAGAAAVGLTFRAHMVEPYAKGGGTGGATVAIQTDKTTTTNTQGYAVLSVPWSASLDPASEWTFSLDRTEFEVIVTVPSTASYGLRAAL